MTRRRYDGRYATAHVRDSAPLLYASEASRLARILGQRGIEAKRRKRSAWVRAHIAALSESMGAER